MAGLVPAIHAKAAAVQQKKTWMAGTRPSAGPAMTQRWLHGLSAIRTFALRCRNVSRMMTPIDRYKACAAKRAQAHDPAKCERFADKIMR